MCKLEGVHHARALQYHLSYPGPLMLQKLESKKKKASGRWTQF